METISTTLKSTIIKDCRSRDPLDFWNHPNEDIYTIEDGEPIEDSEQWAKYKYNGVEYTWPINYVIEPFTVDWNLWKTYKKIYKPYTIYLT